MQMNDWRRHELPCGQKSQGECWEKEIHSHKVSGGERSNLTINFPSRKALLETAVGGAHTHVWPFADGEEVESRGRRREHAVTGGSRGTELAMKPQSERRCYRCNTSTCDKPQTQLKPRRHVGPPKRTNLLPVNTLPCETPVTLRGSPRFPSRSICETPPSILELSGRPVGTRILRWDEWANACGVDRAPRELSSNLGGLCHTCTAELRQHARPLNLNIHGWRDYRVFSLDPVISILNSRENRRRGLLRPPQLFEKFLHRGKVLQSAGPRTPRGNPT
ncbi:hypothetical protein CCH79_00016071 [Gambusia affinis]|uniref:Uncharacterized protein n=1 Tax=Gambusia affinis TaxID=33528 RepID=A0A315VB79_GAMAF|nr:hypothetical protein CCH79_00016071 [Gambusia affinis]